MFRVQFKISLTMAGYLPVFKCSLIFSNIIFVCRVALNAFNHKPYTFKRSMSPLHCFRNQYNYYFAEVEKRNIDRDKNAEYRPKYLLRLYIYIFLPSDAQVHQPQQVKEDAKHVGKALKSTLPISNAYSLTFRDVPAVIIWMTCLHTQVFLQPDQR